MTWQSAWEQAKSVRLRRHTVIGLVAGILIGLTLGLLIGWVWWPVEWQGAETAAVPAATTVTGTLGSQFETPEAKALYLGAVADSFVYASAAGETDAAAIAAQRLAALGGDMRAAFNNAIDFYNAQAGGAARVNNLTTLAMAVGIPLNNGAAAAPAAGATAPAAAATAGVGEQAGVGTASTAASTAANTGSSNWLLTLLGALLLIGGGIAILLYLQRRQAAAEDGGAFVEEEPASAEPSAVAFARDELNPPRTSYTPAASVRSTVGRPQAVQGGGFDSEDLNEYGSEYGNEYGDVDDENGDEARYAAEDARDAHVGYRSLNVEDEDRDAWGDDNNEDEEEADAGEPQERRGPPPSGFVTSVGATPPFSGGGATSTQGAGGQGGQPPAASQTPAAQPAPARTSPTLQPPTPSRYEHFAPVESYTATYYVGRADFDYTKNVPSLDGNGYDGEYGIGIHEKLGLLNNDLEKVIAIDVYLFDKTDERQPITISRSLLSLFADKRRAEFERAGDRENKTLPPIVAQPNTNFQLEGRQLLLDCLIKQVDYTTEGYFRSVTVELVLKRKG